MKHVWQKNLSTGENIRKRVEDRRNQIISTPGVRVDRTSHGVRIRLPKTRSAASSGSSTTLAWSLDVSTATTSNNYACAITPGYIYFGGTHTAASGTGLTIGSTNYTVVNVLGGTINAPHYVYLEIDISVFGFPTATIAAVAVASIPASDVNTIRIVLHEVYRSGTSVVHKVQHQCSTVMLQTFTR